MAGRRWSQIGRGLATVIALTVVWRLLAAADLDRAWGLIRAAGPKIALVLLPFFVGMSVDNLVWQRILHGMGHPVRFWALLRVRIGTEALFMTLPGGTVACELAKPPLLQRTQGVPPSAGAASVAVKKALYLLASAAYLAVGLVGGVALSRELGQLLPTVGWGRWLLPAITTAAVLVVFLLGLFAVSALNRGTVAARLLALLQRLPSRRLRGWLSARTAGFAAADQSTRAVLGRGPGKTLPLVGLLFLQWLTEAFDTFLILWLLGIPASLLPVIAFESLNALTRSILFFLPAGLGAQEIGQLVFLRATGIQDAVSAAAALLVVKRAKDLIWSVVGYGCLFSIRSSSARGEHQI